MKKRDREPAVAAAGDAKKKSKASGRVGTILLSIFFTLFLFLLFFVLFLFGVTNSVALPTAGGFTDNWSIVFFGSLIPVILSSLLAVAFIVMIVLVNTGRVRRIFLALGVSFLVTGVINIAAGILGAYGVPYLSGNWQSLLVNATVTFREFMIVCAVLLAVMGIVFISVYASITAIKGGAEHE